MWGREDPLCVKSQDLKAKLDMDSVRQTERNRDEYTVHMLPGSMFFYDTPHKQCFLRKNNTDTAEFVDSSLRILKTEQENDKIIFPSN